MTTRERKNPRAALSSALAALLLAGAACAEPCAKLEFAELDSLPKDDLLRMRCEYNQQMLDPQLLKAGSYGLGVANRCAAETGRMDRLIARKYQLKNKGSDEVPYFAEINGMCRKP